MPITTLSPSSFTSSSTAVTVKLFAVSDPRNTTLDGTPE